MELVTVYVIDVLEVADLEFGFLRKGKQDSFLVREIEGLRLQIPENRVALQVFELEVPVTGIHYRVDLPHVVVLLEPQLEKVYSDDLLRHHLTAALSFDKLQGMQS